MTERLYYQDSYLREFQASVVDSHPDSLRVYLDRTAFYPTSGGQPFDTGTLAGVEVTEVIDEGERIAHVLSAPLPARQVAGIIGWERRFDHMQQHTGQHLLSAVLVELFNAPTVSFHLGAEASTIDIALALDPDQLRQAELRTNQIVFENRRVAVSHQHSSEDLNLRKPTGREGLIRIVSIEGLDRSACGGTHVRATGEIGPIQIRKLDRVRGNLRIEFVCGMRTVRSARADWEALSAIGQLFSAPPEETPALVEAQRDKLLAADRERRRLAMGLAETRGRALYADTTPAADGVRRAHQRVESVSDDLRAEAQAFTAGSKSVFVAMAENPPSVLLACSADRGVHAGELLKKILTDAGGRGGGNATLAQGSLPSKAALEQAAGALLEV